MSIKIYVQNHVSTGSGYVVTTEYTNTLIYDQLNNRNLPLEAPKLKLEINKAGSLEFSIYPNNPYWSNQYLKKMNTVVIVTRKYLDDENFTSDDVLFRGRILDIKTNMYKKKRVVCEGDLNFMLDSMTTHDAWTNASPNAAFRSIVELHNKRQVNYGQWKMFDIGNVYLSNTTDQYFEAAEFAKCSDEMDSKVIQRYGGILRTRYAPHDSNGRHYEAYIDCLPDPVNDPTGYNNVFHAWEDKIKFGVNVLEFDQAYPSDEIFNSLFPYGHDKLRVDIPDGQDPSIMWHEMVNWSIAGDFGLIDKTETWNEITNKAVLQAEAQKFIDRHSFFTVDDYTITAVDMMSLDPTNTEEVKIGDRVRFVCKPSDVDINLICLSIEYDFQNPENTIYKIGNFVPADAHKGSGKVGCSSRGGSGSSSGRGSSRRGGGGSGSAGISSTLSSVVNSTEPTLHYHDISASESGNGRINITLGAVTTEKKSTNFNIADTQFYQDGVSAATQSGKNAMGVEVDGVSVKVAESETKSVSIDTSFTATYIENSHWYTIKSYAGVGENVGEENHMTEQVGHTGTEAYVAGVRSMGVTLDGATIKSAVSDTKQYTVSAGINSQYMDSTHAYLVTAYAGVGDNVGPSNYLDGTPLIVGSEAYQAGLTNGGNSVTVGTPYRVGEDSWDGTTATVHVRADASNGATNYTTFDVDASNTFQQGVNLGAWNYAPVNALKSGSERWASDSKSCTITVNVYDRENRSTSFNIVVDTKKAYSDGWVKGFQDGSGS